MQLKKERYWNFYKPDSWSSKADVLKLRRTQFWPPCKNVWDKTADRKVHLCMIKRDSWYFTAAERDFEPCDDVLS